MIRAIIFDLDGTLADTEELHRTALAQVLATEQIDLSRGEYFDRLVGYTDRDCFITTMREHGRPFDDDRISDLIARKAALYQGFIAGRDILFPGAADFVRKCAERFPLIVVTGTLRAEAEMILRRSGVRQLFVDVIAAEDVERGKPEPDGFIVALGRLGFALRSRPPIDKAECLVIEDTPAGIEAARCAGMKVLAIGNSVPSDALAGADLVRRSFAETDLDEVLRRFPTSGSE